MSIKREIPSNNFIIFTKSKAKMRNINLDSGSINLKLSSYAIIIVLR